MSVHSAWWKCVGRHIRVPLVPPFSGAASHLASRSQISPLTCGSHTASHRVPRKESKGLWGVTPGGGAPGPGPDRVEVCGRPHNAMEGRMNEHDGSNGAWACGVTLKRTREGPMWTIAVPADGQDHRALLEFAKEQALEIWRSLEEAMPRHGK